MQTIAPAAFVRSPQNTSVSGLCGNVRHKDLKLKCSGLWSDLTKAAVAIVCFGRFY